MSDLSSGVIVQLGIGNAMDYEMALVAWATKAYKHALMLWKVYLDEEQSKGTGFSIYIPGLNKQNNDLISCWCGIKCQQWVKVEHKVL